MTAHASHTEATAIAELGVQAAKANRLDTHTPAIVLPEGCRVESLEIFGPLRTRLRAAFSTRDLVDFGRYVNQRAEQHPQGSPQAFIDPDKMACTAVFNIGDASAPGHADDVAMLQLAPSAAYAEVRRIDSVRFSQKDLAEWLDDWQHMLSPFYGSPDSETAPEVKGTALRRAIRAVRAIEIKEGATTVTHVGNLHNSASALSSIEARSEHELPNGFVATVEPYPGFQIRELRLDLAVGTESPPRLRLRIARKERLVEELALEFVTLVRAQSPQLAPLIGSYAPR